MKMSSDLYLTPSFIEPVERLFKAAYALAEVSECTKEYKSICKKLEPLLLKQKTNREGVKKYDRITYHPNGLCVFEKTHMKLALSPWEKPEIEEKDVATKAYLKQLEMVKNRDRYWWYQIKIYKKIPVTVYPSFQINIKEILDSIKKYEEMPEEGRQFVNINELKRAKEAAGRNLFYSLNFNLYNRTSLCEDQVFKPEPIRATFLTEEDMKAYDYIQKEFSKRDSYNELWKWEDDVNKKRKLCIGLTADEVLQYTSDPGYPEQHFNNYGGRYSKYRNVEIDYEKFLDIIYPKFQAIEDENLRTVFKKMKIL